MSDPSRPFFSVVVGLSGLAIAWQKNQAMLEVYLHIDHFLAAAAGPAFLLLAAIVRTDPATVE